jgi:hypothetical protein
MVVDVAVGAGVVVTGNERSWVPPAFGREVQGMGVGVWKRDVPEGPEAEAAWSNADTDVRHP